MDNAQEILRLRSEVERLRARLQASECSASNVLENTQKHGPVYAAIAEVWGERCPDFEPECPCCKAWAAWDEMQEAAEGERGGFDDGTADKILGWLAEAVGAKDWSPCDGTETWDGDVHGSIYRILAAAGVWNEETGEIARAALKETSNG